jgi:hypothetical protein
MFLLLAAHDVARELVPGSVRTRASVGPYVNWTLFLLTLLRVAMWMRAANWVGQ